MFAGIILSDKKMIKAVPVDKKCSYIKASALMVLSFIQLKLVDSLTDFFFLSDE